MRDIFLLMFLSTVLLMIEMPSCAQIYLIRTVWQVKFTCSNDDLMCGPAPVIGQMIPMMINRIEMTQNIANSNYRSWHRYDIDKNND